MRITTDIAVDSRSVMTAAPVSRAPEAFATACRLVSGQECFGSAAAVWQVESVSGTGLAGAAGFLGLIALGEGLLERQGYAGQPGHERPRPVVGQGVAPVTGPVQDAGQPGQPQRDGGEASDVSDGSDSSKSNDSSKGDNGSKPMTPWDFRTSSPPG